MLDRAVRQTAKFIMEKAVEHCPVDTGAMRASIYCRDRFGAHRLENAAGYGAFKRSTGLAALVASRHTGRKKTAYQFNYNDSPTAPLEAVVECGAAYGPYVEFGTSKQVAQPFMMPAANAGEDKLLENVYFALGSGVGWGRDFALGAEE